MADRMKADLVCDALKMAHSRRKPGAGLIAHLDRGSQYASGAYRALLERFGMVQSMSRRGCCWDNAPAESFFKTLKVERVHRIRYGLRAEARLNIIGWIEGYYNRRRLHSAIGYRSSVEMENRLLAA